MNFIFRDYNPTDKETCLSIFDSNCPIYFAENERDEFEEYLSRYALKNFWVIILDSEIIACGGIHIKESGTGRLCYGIVRNNYHKQGIGKLLLEFRINKLINIADVRKIEIDTSQKTATFFKKLGFVVKSIKENFYTEGLDCFTMEKILDSSCLEFSRCEPK